MKFAILIKKSYAAIQKPTAAIFFVVAAVAGVLGNVALQQAAILGMSGIVLKILCDIHSELSNHHRRLEPQIFENFQSASVEMRKIIDREIKTKNKISLKWLGTCMDTGWVFLNDYLEPIISQQLEINAEIKIEIVMLDPDWRELEQVNRFWKGKTQRNFSAIKQFIADHSNSKIIIELKTYKNIPYYTGLFVSNKYLFLGLCQWANDEYAVGNNFYTLYIKDNNPDSQKNIAQYEHWFKFLSGANASTK
jgi:hypothetical protein